MAIACVEDVLNSSSSDQDKIQLMPVLWARVCSRYLVLRFGLEKGVGYTEAVISA